MTADRLTARLDDFTMAYAECALWSSTTDDGSPMDRHYDFDDFASETLARFQADCERFQNDNEKLIWNDNMVHVPMPDYEAAERAGHDFWLTRNGHGAGFWDGDWSEPAASELTAAAKRFGQCDLYVGDDGRLYV